MACSWMKSAYGIGSGKFKARATGRVKTWGS